MNADGLLEVVSDISEQLIEKQENQQNNSDFNLHRGILQELKNQLQKDWGTDELRHHGEGNEQKWEDEPDSGEPPDHSC